MLVDRTMICNYANDTSFFACHPDIRTIVRKFEADGAVLENWISDNYFKFADK